MKIFIKKNLTGPTYSYSLDKIKFYVQNEVIDDHWLGKLYPEQENWLPINEAIEMAEREKGEKEQNRPTTNQLLIELKQAQNKTTSAIAVCTMVILFMLWRIFMN